VVIAGPSGVGKGSVVARARELFPRLWVSVSWATRAARPGESDGVHYHFVDEARFRAEIAAGGFLEWAEYAGHYKGTPRAAVTEHLAAGIPALLEIDLQGARQVREAMPEALQVFLKPPSLEELVRRLEGRGTEDADQIRRRMQIAERELAAEPEFDATVVNDDVESAARRLVELITTT
jgi:guanylate kinase